MKVACPKEEWSRDGIKFAFRVGQSKDDKPTMTIMRFRNEDDKYMIYNGRDKLRENGILVGNDLTSWQRDQLKLLRERRQTGYYIKGRLEIRDNTSPRVFRKAFRRVDSAVKMDTDLTEKLNVQGHIQNAVNASSN